VHKKKENRFGQTKYMIWMGTKESEACQFQKCHFLLFVCVCVFLCFILFIFLILNPIISIIRNIKWNIHVIMS